MKKELWYLLIEGQQDAETGVIGNFYAYGKHLGDALSKAIKASLAYNFSNQHLTKVAFLKNFDVIKKKHELIEIEKDVYMRKDTFTFSYDDLDGIFIPPTGIVKTTDEDEYDYESIKENFVAYGKNEEGIFEFELVVTKTKLIHTFFKAMDFLPSVDGFWIEIKDYWEMKKTERWTAKHFTNKSLVLDFLKSQQINTLENGFLDIVVHSLSGETNLTLDDHKKIQLHTKDEAVFNAFIRNIAGLGFEQTREEFYNLEFGYHHFHYRLGGSLERREFEGMLIGNGFERMSNKLI